MSAAIRVLVCDDHALFREGLCAIFRGVEQIQVVGEAADGLEAVEKARQLRPDVVLMDIEMPALSGIEATRRIVSGERPRVLALTMYEDEEVVAGCLDAGAAGYVLKDAPAAELVRAIEALNRGQRYLSPGALTKIVEYGMRDRKAKTPYDLLTGREREVLKLLADGLTGKQIALRLGRSLKTIEAHKYNLMRKLDIHDRAALVKYAIQRKLVRVPVLNEIR